MAQHVYLQYHIQKELAGAIQMGPCYQENQNMQTMENERLRSYNTKTDMILMLKCIQLTNIAVDSILQDKGVAHCFAVLFFGESLYT